MTFTYRHVHELCLACGKSWGKHNGDICPGGGTKFTPAQIPAKPRQSIDDATPAEWDAARRAAMEQTAPAKDNSHPAVWPLVMRDMIDRDQSGREKYGVPLKAHNGRDTLLDAYQEALDLAVYLRTAIYERDGR